MDRYLGLDYDTHAEASRSFEWNLPADYNATRDFLLKHADLDDPALVQAYPDGRRERYTFADLDRRTARLANALADLGVGRGDRVAVVLPQVPANPIAHLACWRIGATSVPMSILFGEEALRHRLDTAEVVVAIADAEIAATIRDIEADLPDMEEVIEVDWRDRATTGEFEGLLEGRSARHEIAETTPETEAVIMFTSGSTGPAKGVVHGQAVWAGTCPSFWMEYDGKVREGPFFTPADWAWIGGLGNVVFPAWHYGATVLGYPMEGFDAGTVFSLLAEFDVRGCFAPPTALRMLAEAGDPPADLALETIVAGGEPLTAEIREWVDGTFSGVSLNEIYGQTEANVFVSGCGEWFDSPEGAIGKPVPGHEVAIVDPETGAEKPPGEVGEIAIRYEGDPMVYDRYLGAPEATAGARVEGWHLTGDLGRRDEEGYVYFVSRDDHLIVTSGYRVGPSEVERVLLDHPEVEQAGVIGVPDDRRGEVIEAHVVPASAGVDTGRLESELEARVRDRLAEYAYPRRFAFRESLPRTTTGKVKREALREGEGQGSREGEGN